MPPTPASAMIYVHDLRSSGVVRNALAIGERLARDRPTMLVAGFRDGLFADPGASRGLRIVTLFDGPAKRGGRIGAALALRRLLARERPSVLLSAGNYSHGTAWLACRGRGAPARIYRVSNEVARGGGPRTAARRGRLRLMAADAARIAIVGEAIGAEPILAAALACRQAVVIRNGVDRVRANRLAMAPSPHSWLDDDIPVILAIGRLHAQKNYAVLIDAFARVRRTRPLRLIILGSGPELQTLERRAAEQGGVADVLFAGETCNVFAWLSRAAVFVLPSLWEGSSVALLEALAVGVPVIASRTAGDARRVLDEGRYGMLVDPDRDALADAIAVQLSQNPVLPGDRADDYGLDQTLNAYASLVDEVADTGRDHRPRR